MFVVIPGVYSSGTSSIALMNSIVRSAHSARTVPGEMLRNLGMKFDDALGKSGWRGFE